MSKLYFSMQIYAGKNSGKLPASIEELATEMPICAVWTHPWSPERVPKSMSSLEKESGFVYLGKGEDIDMYPVSRPLLVVKPEDDGRSRFALFVGGRIQEYPDWKKIRTWINSNQRKD